jgi:hypothetical protein
MAYLLRVTLQVVADSEIFSSNCELKLTPGYVGMQINQEQEEGDEKGVNNCVINLHLLPL